MTWGRPLGEQRQKDQLKATPLRCIERAVALKDWFWKANAEQILLVLVVGPRRALKKFQACINMSGV